MCNNGNKRVYVGWQDSRGQQSPYCAIVWTIFRNRFGYFAIGIVYHTISVVTTLLLRWHAERMIYASHVGCGLGVYYDGTVQIENSCTTNLNYLPPKYSLSEFYSSNDSRKIENVYSKN